MAATLAALASYAGSAASAIGAGASAAASAVPAALSSVGGALGIGGAGAPVAAGALGGDALGAALAPTGVGMLAPEAATGMLGGAGLAPGAGVMASGALPEIGAGMQGLLGGANQAASWLQSPGSNLGKSIDKMISAKSAAPANATPDMGEMQMLGGAMDMLGMGASGQAPPTQMQKRGNPGDLMAAGGASAGGPPTGGGYVVGPDGILHWQGGA